MRLYRFPVRYVGEHVDVQLLCKAYNRIGVVVPLVVPANVFEIDGCRDIADLDSVESIVGHGKRQPAIGKFELEQFVGGRV